MAPTTDATTATPTPDAGADSGAPARWLTQEQQRHWRDFLVGSSRLIEALGQQLERDARLSLGEYEVLVRLSEAPEGTLRMSTLAHELAHSRSRITHTIHRLEVAGLLERRACPADGRGVNAVLTPIGLARLEAAAPGHVDAVRTHLVDVLTDAQLAALGDAMAVVGEALAKP
ncbi:MAG: MarR family winged helix-turn-helix transcriptional regulator [Cellulomonas sp.]